MGQYVQTGICTQIVFSKKEVESKEIEFNKVLDILKQEVNLDLYKYEEDEERYKFILKEENYKFEELAGFLEEQYKLFLDEARLKETLGEVMPALESKKSVEEILELASDKRYQNFQSESYMTSRKCSVWNSIRIEFYTIVYFTQGKIFMECYDDFMLYIEKLIRKGSNYKISGAVRAFIE